MTLVALFLMSLPSSLPAGQALLLAFLDSKISVEYLGDSRLELGHAGILMIDDSGVTKYFEYGRYDRERRGEVRQVTIPNLRFNHRGELTEESLRPVLKRLSDRSGQGGRVLAAYLTRVDYGQMYRFARQAQKEWPEYHWYHNNCTTFADAVLRAGKPRYAPLVTTITAPKNLVVDYRAKGAGEVFFDPNTNLVEVKPGPWWDIF
jgi:hypothetical protein